MEKLAEKYCKSLRRMPDHALLALLVSSDKIFYLSLEKSINILATCENRLQNLLSEPHFAFSTIPADTKHLQTRLLVARELGRRLQIEQVLGKPKISNARDVYELFQHLSDCQYEEFWILMLNRANRVIDKVKISEGGITGTVVDPKKVYKIALESYACSLILVHNHPSGNLSPSEADTALTKKLSNAGIMLDIAVLDHIIIGNDDFYSFADNGHI